MKMLFSTVFRLHFRGVLYGLEEAHQRTQTMRKESEAMFMNISIRKILLVALLSFVFGMVPFTWAQNKKDVTLLNASYDPTRELYRDVNAAFAKYWQGKAGQ